MQKRAEPRGRKYAARDVGQVSWTQLPPAHGNVMQDATDEPAHVPR
jgi:hypothetical protein